MVEDPNMQCLVMPQINVLVFWKVLSEEEKTAENIYIKFVYLIRAYVCSRLFVLLVRLLLIKQFGLESVSCNTSATDDNGYKEGELVPLSRVKARQQYEIFIGTFKDRAQG
ncbi:hypothetical protein ACET3Z_014719 [Daucus carota]